MKKKSDFKCFLFQTDINGNFELHYNPKTEEFMTIKTFDDGGIMVWKGKDYDLSIREEKAFNFAFPEIGEE
jgi:hypothetical protein